MKRFFSFLILFLIILLSIVIGIGVASGAEAEPPKAIEDCSWKPTQATGVYYKCDDSSNGKRKQLVGEGVVTVVICNVPYTIEIDCKPKAATGL
jgi:hypothetical protein